MEIDPELFMTCRLCVDSKGKFQIVPTVQKNIKDFFDIDIQPFDGLSQLICNSCKIILSEFCNVKNTYQEKQKSLLKRAKKEASSISDEDNTKTLQKPNELEENKPADSETPLDKDDEKQLVEAEKKSDKLFNDSANTSKDSDHHDNNSVVLKVCNTESEPVVASHKKSLRLCRLNETHNKLFNCRLCKKEVSNMYSLKKHMKTHRELVSKHKKILRFHCYIPLDRLEGPLENSDDTVKLNPYFILGEGANPDYFITYNNKFVEPNFLEDPPPRRKRSHYNDYFNDSDDDKLTNRSKKYKRLQIFSDSEESTITLPNDSQNENSIIDTREIDKVVETDDLLKGTGLHDPCNILVERVATLAADDTTYTSDNSSNDNSTAIKDKEQKNKSKEKDLSLIEDVIHAAYRRFDSNNDNEKVTVKKNDIRKFLSIGRRVLTQNFRATGLIKYLEKNDVNINWIDQNKGSTVAQNQSKSESHFIRIGSKMEEFPPGNNLYGFTRYDPSAESDTPTDAEKVLMLSYACLQKKISELNNGTKNSDTNYSENQNSIQVPTAPHLLSILNRSQMPFPNKASSVDTPPVVNKQPVNIVLPFNKVSGASNKLSKPLTVNKSVAKKPPPAPQPDLSEDENDDISHPTFVTVNPASVRIKSISKKSNMRLTATTTTNTTNGSKQSSNTVILNKNPVLNPKPAVAITYKNKGRKNVTESSGKSATLVALNQNPAPPLTSTTDPTLLPDPTPVASSLTRTPSPSLPSQYNPSFAGDTVICLDDEESLDNMPVITSTTSLATIKTDETVETPMETVASVSNTEPDQHILKGEIAKQPTVKTSFKSIQMPRILQKSLGVNKMYIKCKPVHELMNSIDNQTSSPVTTSAVTENGTHNPYKTTNFLSIDGTVDRLTIPESNTKINDTVNENGEKVLLDTVMLPNLMTSSPFSYLRTLMNLQGLTLLEVPTIELFCLIKFKLGVHQPPISTMLCLYLFARPNIFCLKVTNGNTVAVVQEMSAAWQLEILKALTDKSVTGKILETASHKGTDWLDSAKLFFSILNSIELKSTNPS